MHLQRRRPHPTAAAACCALTGVRARRLPESAQLALPALKTAPADGLTFDAAAQSKTIGFSAHS